MSKTDPNPTQLEYIDNLINKIYPLILISIGTIGNSFIFYNLTRNQFIKQSTFFYFAFSAVVDTFLLYFGLLKYFLKAYTKCRYQRSFDFDCKFLYFIVYLFQQLSAWISVILITLERLVIIFSTK